MISRTRIYSAAFGLVLLVLLTISAPVSASAVMAQPLCGGSDNVLSQAATEYNLLAGGYSWSSTETDRQEVIPTSGAISDLYVTLSAAVADGSSFTFTLVVNGSPSALTCTIAASGTTGSDATHSVDVVAGDTVNIQSSYTGTPGEPSAVWSTLWTSSSNNEGVFLSNTYCYNSGTYRYAVVMGSGNHDAAGEAASQSPMPDSATFSDLYVKMATAPGSGSYTYELRENGATQSPTVTISNAETTGSDTSNSFSSVASDLINMRIVRASATNASMTGWGMVCTTTTDFVSVFLGGSLNGGNTTDISSASYVTFAPSSTAWSTDTTGRYTGILTCELTDFYVFLTSAPGTGNSYNIDVLDDDSATGLAVRVSGAGTTGSDVAHTGSVSVNSGMTIRATPDSGPTTTYVGWGLLIGITPEKEIENTPSSKNFGLVSENTTYYAKGGLTAPDGGLDVVHTNDPTSNTGSAWTNPEDAYADGGSYASLASGTPSSSNVWGDYGFDFHSNVTVDQVRVRYDAWSAGSVGGPATIAIRCQASGTVNSAASSPYGAVIPKPTSPSAIQDDDVLVICLGKDDDTGTFEISGWTIYQEHVNSTVDNSAAILYKVVTDYTSEPSEYTVLTGDGNEEVNYLIFALTNVDLTNIEDVSFTGVLTSTVDTTPNVPAITPVTTGAFVLAMVAVDADTDISMPGGTWTTLEEDIAGNNNLSVVWKYGTASTSTGTADFSGLGSSDQTIMGQFAFRPVMASGEYSDQIRVDVSWDGGSNWSSTQNTAVDDAETTYWYDVTSATTWDYDKLSDANLQVRALAYTIDDAEVIYLDYLAVEATVDDPNVQSDECTFMITNSGLTAFDVELSIADFTGGNGWNIVSSSPGEDEVRITMFYAGQLVSEGLVLTNSNQAWYAGLNPGATLYWDIKIETGTFTDGGVRTATLTITAVNMD